VLAVMLYSVIRFEERELLQRFGAEYEAYCALVPRFIPNLHR
jgi:protein-S-isoprenylcysteine O-methyltransferase Ste14